MSCITNVPGLAITCIVLARATFMLAINLDTFFYLSLGIFFTSYNYQVLT